MRAARWIARLRAAAPGRGPAVMLPVLAALAVPSAQPARGQEVPAALSACAAGAVLSTSGLRGPRAELARAAELVGASPLRAQVIGRVSSHRRTLVCEPDALPWQSMLSAPPADRAFSVRALPVRLDGAYNGAYPDDRNNGVMWAGRGLSVGLSTGAAVSWGPLSAALAPVVVSQQNRDFPSSPTDLPGRYRLVYPWHEGRIDWPQRMGTESFWTLDPGQSYIRLDVSGAAVGVSNENLWWGPGQRTAILLSNTAPGFPHAFVGTSAPLGVGIGSLEGELIWGKLDSSDYYSPDAADRNRLFGGLILSFTPAALDGLSLGLARIYQARLPPDGLGMLRAALLPYGASLDDGQPPRDNVLLGLFARWAVPTHGFEAYVEWAREEAWSSAGELLREPDHSQGYTIGFQQVLRQAPGWIRVYGELTHLLSSLTFQRPGEPVVFFTDSDVPQGHTHRGQILGAGIGPGSDLATLGVERFTSWGRTGVYGERIRHDADAYYANWARFYGIHGHDIELSASVYQTLALRGVELQVEAGYSHRTNRSFLGFDGEPIPFRAEDGLKLRLDAMWRPEF